MCGKALFLSFDLRWAEDCGAFLGVFMLFKGVGTSGFFPSFSLSPGCSAAAGAGGFSFHSWPNTLHFDFVGSTALRIEHLTISRVLPAWFTRQRP